ncbi:MAG: hypothetical protein PHN75_21005, partial [Syntrophales bacterium]|nr:hypothetical protein [Syntrophales bacterium]
MKRRHIIWFFGIAMGLLIAAGALAWLLGTNQGARWLFERAVRNLPVVVKMDRIEGSLAGEMKLEGIMVRHADREVSIAKGTVSWHPLEMLFGHIAFRTIRLERVSWDEKKVESKPPDLTWPEVSGVWLRLWGGVDAMELEGFTFRKPGKEPIAVDHARAKLQWFFGTLTVSGIDLLSPLGRVTGKVGAGFDRPTLFGEVVFSPSRPIAGHDRLSISMKSMKASLPEQVSSEVGLAVFSGNDPRFTAAGRIGIKKEGLVFHDLEIREQGRPGTVTASGEVIVSLPKIFVDGKLQARDLNIVKDGKKDGASLSGTLTLKGNPDLYEGRFDIRQRSSSAAWLSGHLQGEVTGNDRGMTIREMTGGILGGSVAGSMEWIWEAHNRLSWQVKARGLDPAVISSEWRGRVNIDAGGSLIWDNGKPVRGTVKADLIDSIMRGKTLSGSMEARWDEGTIGFVRGDLRGKDFNLTLKGKPSEILSYQAKITDLSGIVPASAGRINCGGWIRWKKGKLAGIVKGRGLSLSIAGMKADAADIDVRLNERTADDIYAKVVLMRPAYGTFGAGGAELSAKGKVTDHEAKVALKGQEGSIQLSLNGGYARNAWQGRVAQGTLQDRQAGTLRLSSPAQILISMQQLRVSGLSFIGTDDENVFINADLKLQPRRGYVNSGWRKLNLARANAILGN